MSQTWDVDLIVPATTSPATDIQRIIDGFNALRSVFSGAAEPAVADQVAYMFWADTTTGLLKQRNAANNAWITLGTMASANLGLLPLSGGNMTGGINNKLTTVASATTPDIFALTVGNTVDYTGTATATGFAASPQAGAQRTLVCAAASVFTAGANMLIDGVTSGLNFTAAAGDKILVIAVTTTQFRLTPLLASGAGALTLIQSQSASASASVDFTSGFTSLYDAYEFTLTNIVSATDLAVLTVRVSQDGGSTFKAGATDYAYTICNSLDAVAPATSGSTGATQINLITLNNAAAKGASGRITLFGPANTTANKLINGCLSGQPSTGNIQVNSVAGVFKLNTAAINAVRFIMSAGNITSGVFTLYGIRKG